MRTSLSAFTFVPVILVFVLISVFVGQGKPTGDVAISGCWSFQMVPGRNETGLASDGKLVVVSERNSRIGAIADDGAKLWEADLGGTLTSNLMVTETAVIAASRTGEGNGGGNTQLRSLSKLTGITQWQLDLPVSERNFLGIYNDNIILVASNGTVRSIDHRKGGVVWTREITDEFVSPPAFDGARVAVAGHREQIFLIDLSTAEIESIIRVPFRVTSLAIDASSVFAGDVRGNVRRFVAARDRPVWTMKAGAQISSLRTVNGDILVASNDNFVYFVRGSNGSVNWKRRLSGRVGFSTTIGDRFSLAASIGDSSLHFTHISSGRSAGQIVLGNGEAITAEPVAVDGMIFVLSNNTAYAYSTNGCKDKHNGGAALQPHRR